MRSSACSSVGECADITRTDHGIRIARVVEGHTKAAITFTVAEWAALVEGVKAGEFDHLTDDGGPTHRALNRDRIRRLDNRPPPPSEMDRLLAGQCTHGHGTTDRCPTCSITLRMIAGINQMATAIFGARPDTPATTRALRASERDDHRKEQQ